MSSICFAIATMFRGVSARAPVKMAGAANGTAAAAAEARSVRRVSMMGSLCCFAGIIAKVVRRTNGLAACCRAPAARQGAAALLIEVATPASLCE